MEFAEVLKARRMVRHYLNEPVDPAVVDRVIAAGLRAPSAGYSQGYGLLVLADPADRAKFWSVAAIPQETASWAPATLAAMQRAPVIVVALSCKRIYLDRYARPDKGWTDRDESRWVAPYWHIDTGMVALLMLLQIVDEGLGGLFMGIAPAVVDDFRDAFDVPADHDVVGVVCFGHPDPNGPTRDLKAQQRRTTDVVHWGNW